MRGIRLSVGFSAAQRRRTEADRQYEQSHAQLLPAQDKQKEVGDCHGRIRLQTPAS